MAKRKAKQKTAADSPFGEASRVELLEQHLHAFGRIDAANAWMFVYEELLWFDQSTGMLHLYESDKTQEGRSSWHGRSKEFTRRLCELYGVDVGGLRARLDRLFLACLERQVAARAADDAGTTEAVAALGKKIGVAPAAVEQAREAAERSEAAADFVPYAELVAEVIDLLVRRAGMNAGDAAGLAREIVDRSRYHLNFGKNRQNALGEGFEDLLKLLAVRVARVPEARMIVRREADQLPGFKGTPEKVRRIETPDLAIVEGTEQTELLATVKWSLRHDRQKQLSDELDCFVQLLSQDGFPEYVLVTNEYDPGRLKNSSNLTSRGKTVDCIYHVNPQLVVDVLSDVPKSVGIVKELIADGRLKSLEDLLNDLARRYGPGAA